jgi:predicted  nucleic acid-binding Zn-ribbon protein
VNDRVLTGANATNVALKEINNKTQKITKAVDSANQRLAKTQDALGELIKKYRRPNKFCLDITLVVMLLGLIAVVVNMVTKKSTT